MKIYVRGIPITYYTDDYIPFNSYGVPAFAKQASDGSLWPMLIEKTWAKITGNYERTIGGNAKELFNFIAGLPTDTYYTKDTTADAAYTLIADASAKGYVLSGSVSNCGVNGDADYNSNGLVCGHAYSVLGASTVTDNGNSVKLIEVRNPWSKDTWNGNYRDDAMSADVKKQLGHTASATDGIFYMTTADFITNFSAF